MNQEDNPSGTLFYCREDLTVNALNLQFSLFFVTLSKAGNASRALVFLATILQVTERVISLLDLA
jgi:hypothetical protein